MNDHDANLLRAKADLLAASQPDLVVIRAQYDVSTERTDVERDVLALLAHIDAQAERLARAVEENGRLRALIAAPGFGEGELMADRERNECEACGTEENEVPWLQGEVARLTAALARAERLNVDWKDEAETAGRSREEMRADLAAARDQHHEVLLTYGSHLEGCTIDKGTPCSCGFDGYLFGAEGEVTPVRPDPDGTIEIEFRTADLPRSRPTILLEAPDAAE